MQMVLVESQKYGFHVPVEESRINKIQEPLPLRGEVRKRSRVQAWVDQGLKGSISQALSILDKYSPKEEPAKKRVQDDGCKIVNRQGHKSDRDIALSATLGRAFFGF